jgi:hypothetical protein
MGSASEAAGLLNSLKGPLSGNLVLQITPYTSLKLRASRIFFYFYDQFIRSKIISDTGEWKEVKKDEK